MIPFVRSGVQAEDVDVEQHGEDQESPGSLDDEPMPAPVSIRPRAVCFGNFVVPDLVFGRYGGRKVSPLLCDAECRIEEAALEPRIERSTDAMLWPVLPAKQTQGERVEAWRKGSR